MTGWSVVNTAHIEWKTYLVYYDRVWTAIAKGAPMSRICRTRILLAEKVSIWSSVFFFHNFTTWNSPKQERKNVLENEECVILIRSLPFCLLHCHLYIFTVDILQQMSAVI